MTPDELLLWRRGRNINQGQLADLLGISRQTVIRWERGRSPVPDDLHVKLVQMGGPRLEGTRQQQVSGRITPAAYKHLFQRVGLQYGMNHLHPIALARKGLLGWPGCTWRNASSTTGAPPHRDLLETEHYQNALTDLAAKRQHPGVVLRRQFYYRGAGALNEVAAAVDPTALAEARQPGFVAPWADAEPRLGFNYCADMPAVETYAKEW